jgi:hypothetical protein
MARKPVEREFEEHMVGDMMLFLYETLIDGARKNGATLTQGECRLLLDHLGTPPAGNPRWRDIAMFSYMHGRDGVENAVRKTMKEFGCSRAEVFAARARADEYDAHSKRVCGKP